MKENENKNGFLFEAVNYKFLLIGGGGSEDPNVFKEDELFSFRRIGLAPTTVLAGFGVVIYSIFKKTK